MNLPGDSKVFEDLIYPIPLKVFFNEYWEKKPLIVKRNDASVYADILCVDDMNSFLKKNDIRYPTIRLAKDGVELPLEDYSKNLTNGRYTMEGLIDTDKLFGHFKDGATIVFQLIHKSIHQLTFFANALEKYFKFRIQVNIYMTPQNSQGFTPHYDTHDVFIMQIDGKKLWKLYDSPVKLPTEDQKFDKKTWQPTEPISEIMLEPGDLIYIPRGYIHAGSTNENISTHITLGIYQYTWLDVLSRLLVVMKNDAELRKSPMNTLLSGEKTEMELNTQLSETLDYIKSNYSSQEIFRSLFDYSNSRQLFNSENRLRDFYLLENLSPHSRLMIREGISYKTTLSDKDISIFFYDKKISFPIHVADALSHITKSKEFIVGEIQDTLDDKGKMILCSKLITEGLVTIIA